MRERENVFVQTQDGNSLSVNNAEITRTEDDLIIYGPRGSTIRVNRDHISYYEVWPLEVKNLDD